MGDDFLFDALRSRMRPPNPNASRNATNIPRCQGSNPHAHSDAGTVYTGYSIGDQSGRPHAR